MKENKNTNANAKSENTKDYSKALAKENENEKNAKALFETLAKTFNSDKITVKHIENANAKTLYSNNYSRVNFIANANANKTMFYFRYNSENSLFFVVNNETMYNATSNAVKSLVKRESVKYKTLENNKKRIVDCAYYCTKENAVNIAKVLIECYSKTLESENKN